MTRRTPLHRHDPADPRGIPADVRDDSAATGSPASLESAADIASRREAILALAGSVLSARVRQRRQVRAALATCGVAIVVGAAGFLWQAGVPEQPQRPSAVATQAEHPATRDNQPAVASGLEGPVIVEAPRPATRPIVIQYVAATEAASLADRFAPRAQAPDIAVKRLTDDELLGALAQAGVKHEGLARVGQQVTLIGWQPDATTPAAHDAPRRSHDPARLPVLPTHGPL